MAAAVLTETSVMREAVGKANQTTIAMADRLAKAQQIHLQLSYSIASRAGDSSGVHAELALVAHVVKAVKKQCVAR